MPYRLAFAGAALLAGVGLGLPACAPTMLVDAATTVAEERSLGTVADDTGITLEINSRFLSERYRYLFLDVSTNVYEGRVLLTGAVGSERDKTTATKLVEGIDGVREVINELQVTPGGELASSADDIWIETKLKARLVGTKGVKSINYRWRSVNGVVYFIGIAQNRRELNRLVAVARDTQHVRKVVTHVRVK